MQAALSGDAVGTQRVEELFHRRHKAGIGPRVPTHRKTPDHTGYKHAVLADWRELAQGDSVVLLNSRKEAVGGVVDETSADGSLLWIHQDDCAGRRLFHRADGCRTFLDATDHSEEAQAPTLKIGRCLTE